jgi:hypothetical protein
MNEEPEKQSLWRKRNQESIHLIRNQILEEVAREIEKMKGFGQDTIASFCIFIRKMKK